MCHLYSNWSFIVVHLHPRATANQPAALFYIHRQFRFTIKPDAVNQLGGIVSVFAGAYLEAYAIAFVNLPKGLLVIQRSEHIRMGLRSNTIPPLAGRTIIRIKILH